MNGFLLDTHIWLWHLGSSPRLPGRLRALIDRRTDRCMLSPITIWETGLLVGAGKFKIDRTFKDWARVALQILPLQDAPLTREVAMEAQIIALGHRDPADHLLVATALVYDLTLLTVDHRLTHVPGLRIRST